MKPDKEAAPDKAEVRSVAEACKTALLAANPKLSARDFQPSHLVFGEACIAFDRDARTRTAHTGERIAALEAALHGFVDDLTDNGRNPGTCLSINHDALNRRIALARTALAGEQG